MTRFTTFYNHVINQLVVVVAVALWSSIGLCHLPEAVAKVIEGQKSKFQEVLHTSTPEQRALILERYADLLQTSPFGLEVKFDRTELIAHLTLVFGQAPRKQVVEPPKFSPSVDAELAQILKSFKGDFREGLLHLNFKCEDKNYELPFKIEAAGPIAFEMSLRGVPVPQELDKVTPFEKCLSIFFVAKNLPATLETINTANVACPLPPKRAGTCLLDWAEQIVASTKRDRVRLTDGSKIRCRRNHQPTSLWRLRVYQGRPTWYESNGYQVVERMRKKREAALNSASTYKLENLIADLDKPKDIPMARAQEATELLKNLAQEFQDPRKNITVAQFMSTLWERDCAAYVLIDELITWPLRGFEYGALFPTVDEFEKVLR